MASSPTAPPRRFPRWLLPVAGWVICAASLYWVFRGFNLDQALADMRSLAWHWVTLAVIFDLLTYVVGGWRWTILLNRIGHAGLWRAVQSIYIGLYANEILPLRPGEIIRSYLIAKWTKIPVSLAISAAAIERVQEGVWMVMALAAASFFVELPTVIVAGTRTLAIGVAILATLLLYIVLRRERVHEFAETSKLPAFLRHIIDGLADMGDPRPMALSMFATLVYIAMQVVPYWALMEAYQLDLTIWQATLTLVIVRLGTVIPNAPGNVGLFQFVCVIALGMWGVDKSRSVGFSVVLFSVLTLPLLIGGFIATALSGLKLGDIHSGAREETARPTTPKEVAP